MNGTVYVYRVINNIYYANISKPPYPPPIMITVNKLFRLWRQRKILTLPKLISYLGASVRTARRRLKAWGCLASFNHNGRFYTLPDIPQFDAHGLWFHQQIGFSRLGHLPQTLVALIHQAPGGLTAAQLGQILRLNPRSFLWQFHSHPDIQRLKHQGRFVYLAANPPRARAQMAQRTTPTCATLALPSPLEAVALLVEAIKHPKASPEQLCQRLRPSHPQITP
jgi:hypothetical protein